MNCNRPIRPKQWASNEMTADPGAEAALVKFLPELLHILGSAGQLAVADGGDRG